jgi:ASPIC and UnbV/FG-GAP-like repeat
MTGEPTGGVRIRIWGLVGVLAAAAVASVVVFERASHGTVFSPRSEQPNPVAGRAAGSQLAPEHDLNYQPLLPVDTAGFGIIQGHLRWKFGASLEEIGAVWKSAGYRAIEQIDQSLLDSKKTDADRLKLLLSKAGSFNYEGEPARAYEVLEQTRAWLENPATPPQIAEMGLYSVIFFQGVTALRRGENENCIMCRGESSCIIPIAPAAVHTNPAGSRLAIKHFREYLARFPDDLGVKWLLNLAHMTLGEHPRNVDRRYLVPLDHFEKSEFAIGKFRDIGQQAGVNRFNCAGGAVMDDFDGDGLLDLATTTFLPTEPMSYYHNNGHGTFDDRTERAGLMAQLGGKNLVQTDYNNDGRLDLFISRGAWLYHPIRPSLLKNDGGGVFTDVTREAGLDESINSTASRWADYDNDGRLDVFLVCELQGNRLYHNRGDGTFEEVTGKAGLKDDGRLFCKGADWLDFDNDDFPDLFIDNLKGDARLYHNDRHGTFTDVTTSLAIDGPKNGFSCWAWDYDNDGWLDIFATCYDYTLADIVKGLLGEPHDRLSNRLFRNVGGKRFENKTKEAGLDLVFATMGCNFGDVDNDGFLDMYLGTGDPDFSLLVPNRMFKNVRGERFAEITASAGTGNLQKGHGVSFADWDRDGDLDLFVEMGGAVPGDKYHNILFQNPGQGNHWLTVKLVGQKTNRAAIGARIKLVTSGEEPLTVHRHVSSGSSWGANPLEQHLGLGKAARAAVLEIHWPTSGTTQTFRDIAADQAIEVTEFAESYRPLNWKPIRQPK